MEVTGLMLLFINILDAKYRIVGVLNATGEIIDNLLLTSLETVWEAHNDDHQQGSFDLKYEKNDHTITITNHQHKSDKEITAFL